MGGGGSGVGRVRQGVGLTDEEKARLKKKIDFIIQTFKKVDANPTTELKYRNAYELVVATILSAQCTDRRVNAITPALFQRYPTVESLARATPEEVYEYIKTCSYPNNKAKYLVAMARKVVQEFGGRIPERARDLMRLPGVGRKSAHVIAATLYGEPVIGVDTHVFRVTRRLGLHRMRHPHQVERLLMELVPEGDRPRFHHWLILHGRYVCKARNPDCGRCLLTEICEEYKRRVQKEGDG